jgi:hypothetical protein
MPAMVSLLLAPPQDEAVAKLLSTAQDCYRKRDQDGMAVKAVGNYKKALARDETCTGAYWRIARTYYWVGTNEKDTARAAETFREGIDFAKIAISLDENCIEARFWLAVMYGLYGQARGILQSLHMVDPMKRELEWVRMAPRARQAKAKARLTQSLPALPARWKRRRASRPLPTA